MAAPYVHAAAHRKSSSGDRPNRARGNRPPLPLLPDDALHNIFSFLHIEDAVRTSVLSRRWRSTWTSTTHLVFDGFRPRNRDPRSLDFPSLVGRVLSQCTSPTVKKLHVTNFKYRHRYRPKLDLWLHFALGRRVEDLRLWLITDQWTRYTLPPFFYCSSWLVRLEVSWCSFRSDETIWWPCLKFLSIEDADLDDDMLGRIFTGSPVLEFLKLGRCRYVKNIIIDSTSVKDLVLIGSKNYSYSYMGKIWAPHLLSLRVSGTWSGPWLCTHIFRLDDISSLVEAELVFSGRTSLFEWMYCNLLKELIDRLCGVPKITIGSWCWKILSSLEMKGVSSLLSKCQSLILRTPISQLHLLGIAYMLRSSQCLERLVIHLTGVPRLKFLKWGIHVQEESKGSCNYDEEDFLCSRKESFQCLVTHLNQVEIIGFKANSLGSKHVLTLIKFLLGNTFTLEKMIIKADLRARNGQKRLQAILSELLAVRQNVLGYQRASKNAEIIFDFPLQLASF
ncbi:hypothetical protein ACJRO7_021413 [Eucalyptus globulus]|uniref:F-box domain-containing protein n=1 Tax=Eucalyptus globulus TaxID=34317 RepID=A0ABD3KMA6_EUCGL